MVRVRRVRGFAYLNPDGSWSFREDFPCVAQTGGESWNGHPWTLSDPSLPTYQDCPRCGARRVRVPTALVPGPLQQS